MYIQYLSRNDSWSLLYSLGTDEYRFQQFLLLGDVDLRAESMEDTFPLLRVQSLYG
jgi:hypothetical protein